MQILAPIVNCLPSKDQLNVTGVSRRWHRLVDEKLGRKLFIGRTCQFIPEDEERYRHHYVEIDAITKVGVNSCYFGEVSDPDRDTSTIGYYIQKLKYEMMMNDAK
jgi:hypothetical protein